MSQRRWYTPLLLGAVLCLFPSVARAEIMVHVIPGRDLGVGGLKQYTISAVGDQGELINVFGQIKLTGAVHQVGAPGGAPTPTAEESSGGFFDPSWREFDSHLLFSQSDLVGRVGSPLVESNDFSTQATLGLSQFMGFEAPSGYGSLTTSDGAYGLLPQAAGDRVSFFQVVTPSVAFLDIEIVGIDHAASTVGTYTFSNIAIGNSVSEATFTGTALLSSLHSAPVAPLPPPVKEVRNPQVGRVPDVPPPPPPVEAPSVEAPSVEAPPVEAPPVEAPPVEAPSVEAPPVEPPSVEVPLIETPSNELPSDIHLIEIWEPTEMDPGFMPEWHLWIDAPFLKLAGFHDSIVQEGDNAAEKSPALVTHLLRSIEMHSYSTVASDSQLQVLHAFGHSGANVPEPSSFFLAACACAAAIVRRRRMG